MCEYKIAIPQTKHKILWIYIRGASVFADAHSLSLHSYVSALLYVCESIYVSRSVSICVFIRLQF